MKGIEKQSEETPPLFSSWKGWYTLIILLLVVQLVFYYLLTYFFNE